MRRTLQAMSGRSAVTAAVTCLSTVSRSSVLETERASCAIRRTLPRSFAMRNLHGRPASHSLSSKRRVSVFPLDGTTHIAYDPFLATGSHRLCLNCAGEKRIHDHSHSLRLT